MASATPQSAIRVATSLASAPAIQNGASTSDQIVIRTKLRKLSRLCRDQREQHEGVPAELDADISERERPAPARRMRRAG